VLVPPLPEKSLLGMGRFENEFIGERRRALEVFLSRVAAHPILCDCEDVRMFLHGEETSFQAAKRAKADSTDPESSAGADATSPSASSASATAIASATGLFNYFKKSVTSIAQPFVGGGAMKEVEATEDDQSCDKINDYANNLGTSLASSYTNVENLVRRTGGLGKTYFDFGLSCTLLGQLESKSKEEALGRAFIKLGNSSDRLSVLLTQKMEQENVGFREVIKDYIRMVDAVKQMMKTRSAAQATYQSALSTLETRQAKLRALQGVPGKEDRVAAVERSVAEAQGHVDRCYAELDKITKTCFSEFARFRADKQRDMKNMLVDFVKLQIEHSKQVQTAWESILTDVSS